jgi:hypothetical protein
MNHDEVTANLLAACDDPFSLLSDEVREWIKQMVETQREQAARIVELEGNPDRRSETQ